MFLLQNTSLQTVDNKFLVSGQIYMECDHDFGQIEKAAKYQQYVFIPHDWVKVVTSSSRKLSAKQMILINR